MLSFFTAFNRYFIHYTVTPIIYFVYFTGDTKLAYLDIEFLCFNALLYSDSPNFDRRPTAD